MILVTGGTGFVGSHLVRRLLAGGRPVRCLARAGSGLPAELRDRVEIAIGDIGQPETLGPAMRGAEAVIHLVGIIRETGTSTFDRVHVTGTENMLAAARENGIDRYLHMSALGTRPQAVSAYHRTKWEAEEAVRASGLKYTIFRPAIIFGKGDGFVSLLADLVRKNPVTPIVGSGRSRLQPIWVEDVARCFGDSLDHDETIGQCYELCGPEALTYEQIVDLLQETLGAKKLKVHLPVPLVRMGSRMLQAFGFTAPITGDQLQMLSEEMLCDPKLEWRVTSFELRKLADEVRERFRQSIAAV